MDKLSLVICCTEMPFPIMPLVPMGPGKECAHLSVTRASAERIGLEPWPFNSEAIRANVGYRLLPVGCFRDESAFRASYTQAVVRTLTLMLQPPNRHKAA